LYRNRIVGLDLPGTRIDQSIGLCYDDDACRTCSQQKLDSSELMQCNGPGRGYATRPIIPSNGNPTGKL